MKVFRTGRVIYRFTVDITNTTGLRGHKELLEDRECQLYTFDTVERRKVYVGLVLTKRVTVRVIKRSGTVVVESGPNDVIKDLLEERR